MTLKEAIEELTRIKGYDEIVGLIITEEAIDLAIEAMKDKQKSRGTLRPGFYVLLPGETDE